MKYIFAGFILTICQVSSAASVPLSTINSDEAFGKFSKTYYLNPKPEQIRGALTYLDSAELIKDTKTRPIITMFFSCILHRTDVQTESYLESTNKLHGSAREIAQAAISKEPDELFKDVKISPLYNDLNWACFFATGDEKYVKNVIFQLGYQTERKDMNLFFTGATAKWSLASSSQSHPIVKAAVVKLSKTDGAPTQSIAQDILRQTPKEIVAEMRSIVQEQHSKGVW